MFVKCSVCGNLFDERIYFMDYKYKSNKYTINFTSQIFDLNASPRAKEKEKYNWRKLTNNNFHEIHDKYNKNSAPNFLQ